MIDNLLLDYEDAIENNGTKKWRYQSVVDGKMIGFTYGTFTTL